MPLTKYTRSNNKLQTEIHSYVLTIACRQDEDSLSNQGIGDEQASTLCLIFFTVKSFPLVYDVLWIQITMEKDVIRVSLMCCKHYIDNVLSDSMVKWQSPFT